MNQVKAAMNLAIVAKLIEKMLFEKSDEATISKKYYREEFMTNFAARAARLVYDANTLWDHKIPVSAIIPAIFLKEQLMDAGLKDIIENKECDKCPAKDICEDKHCAKDPKEMTETEINDLLDSFKKV